MDYEQVILDIDDGVATITLNRPEKLNAYTGRLGAEMSDAFAECDERDEVRAVILTGAGRAFCAGADLEAGGSTFGGGMSNFAAGFKGRSMAPFQMKKPVIAAINGHAVGVGLTIPMQCDIRIVAEDAKLGFVFARRGIMAEAHSHYIVPRLVGLSKAAELFFSGRIFSGREAAEWGLASRAVPAPDVVAAAEELARDIAVNAAPVSVAVSKKLLWESLDLDRDAAARRESHLITWIGGQPDAREGVESFIAKREPKWQMQPSTDMPAWPE